MPSIRRRRSGGNSRRKKPTYEKLTAAINHAKDNGDLATLRKIAEDPQGFILRQGWASLDFAGTAVVAKGSR